MSIDITKTSMKLRREAHRTKINGLNKSSGFIDTAASHAMEQESMAILTCDEMPITALGEVVKPHIANLWRHGKGVALDTLKTPGIVPEEASVKRTDLLLQDSLDITAMAIDAATSIEASNSLEKMLAHQMTLAHELVMKSGNAAMRELEKLQSKQKIGKYYQEEAIEYQRLANSTAKLMNAYSTHLLALQKIRSGGNQTMTVQHVHVNDGGQAVIGNINKGAGVKNE